MVLVLVFLMPPVSDFGSVTGGAIISSGFSSTGS